VTAALHCGDESLQAVEIVQGALRLAASLAVAGIAEGDAFAIMLRNEPRFMLALLAARVLGAYATSALQQGERDDPALTEDAVRQFLRERIAG